MNTLKNGLYLTDEDFEQWQNDMAKFISSEDKCYGNPDIIIDDNDKDIRTKTITFVVTERCNLNCTYCYEKHKTGRRMTKEIGRQAVDFILNKELVNGYYDTNIHNSVILEFIGGEPLLEIELIDYIIEYFKFRSFELNHPWAENYMITFTTNGVLYNDKRVQDFIKRNEGKVSGAITIDGNKKLHDTCRLFPDGSGSYDIVKESINTWIKIQDKVRTKVTLCPDNIMYLNEAIKNVWNIGVLGVSSNCVFEEGWTKKDATVLYSEMKKLSDYLLEDENYTKFYCSLFDEKIGFKTTDTKNWCGGNGRMLAIAPDGKCFPCIRFMKYSLNNQKEQSIGDIWKGLESKKENKWLLKLCDIDMITQCQYEDNKKCLDCPISEGCSLCTAYNYDHFGNPNHKATFTCEMHKARVLANIYYWNKLYKLLNLNKTFKFNIPKEWALNIISEKEYNELIEIERS